MAKDKKKKQVEGKKRIVSEAPFVGVSVEAFMDRFSENAIQRIYAGLDPEPSGDVHSVPIPVRGKKKHYA